MNETNHQIASAPCPDCILCGSKGAPLYNDFQDRLFGAPGTWNLKTCTNAKCGLLWLDPMPLSSEIWKAYSNYYTHKNSGKGRDSFLKRAYVRTKRRWLSKTYKYPVDPADQSIGIFGRACYLIPTVRGFALRDVRFLPFVPGGKLLDVGCGSGDWLAQMKGLGWDVEGVDFDPKAVQTACDLGMRVHLGSLEQQAYPSESFDAITLSHVIEHVPDPIGTIKECARLLKPNGKLVMFTPNAASLSHQYFKQDWRGLEPPRHLHVFSFKSMRNLLNFGDFTSVFVGPDIGTSASVESVYIRRSRKKNTAVGRIPSWRKSFFWWSVCILQRMTARLIPSVAECQVVVAIKK